jgi:hypothetical protein
MNKFKHHYYNAILKEADSKGGTVEDIDLFDCYLNELPEFFKDLTVTGTFNVEKNNLTSCKNFPKFGAFVWVGYNKIKNFDDLESFPSHTFGADANSLTSVESLSKFNNELYQIYLGQNSLSSLKGLENISLKILSIPRNLISSWEYAPKNMRSLRITENKLTSWRGMPPNLEYLNTIGNWNVQNMDGFRRVSTTLYFSSSTLNIETARHLLLEKGISVPYLDVYKYHE